MQQTDSKIDLPAKVRKFAETAPPHEVAEFLLMALAETPELARTRWGIDFISECKKDLKKDSPILGKLDLELEKIRKGFAEYDDFRERVMKLLYSEKLALPDWLMDINELVVHMNYASDPDKKLIAIKAFEKQMYQEFLRFKKNPDDVRWRV